MAKDIFDDVANQFITERSRVADQQREKLAGMYRGGISQFLDGAARDLNALNDKLSAAIQRGTAVEVKFLAQSLIDLSAVVSRLAKQQNM